MATTEAQGAPEATSRLTRRRSSKARYEIIVRGQLAEGWSAWFVGMTVTEYDDGETRFAGVLPDQSALHGVLERIRDLNLELVEVRKLALGDLAS